MMKRQVSARIATTLLFLGALACQDSTVVGPAPIDRPGPSAPEASISDGAHDGNEDFYFLPPLVSAPTTSGDFDDSLLADLAVEVCEWTGSACGTVLVTFNSTTGSGASVLKLDAAAEQYAVNWKTKDYDLDVNLTYRIRVLRSGNELGHADIDVVSSGKELKNVDTNEYIALKEDGVLPIHFRVEISEGITIDARALSAAHFLISGQTGTFPTTAPAFFDLQPGTHAFIETNGGNFNFAVLSDGTVDYDSSFDGFVQGRGTSTLVVRGFDVTIDARALTAADFLIGGQNGTFPVETPLVITRIAGGPKAFIENNGGNFSFTIGLDGNVDYDTSLDGFLGGRGTTTLVVQGFDVTIDATTLTAANFLVGGQNGTFPVETPLVITRIAGLKVFIENNGGNFSFTIGLDGNVDYDTSFDGFLGGRGTTTLVVQGFDVTIDATTLTAANFLVGGQNGTFPVETPLVITRIAGGPKAFIENNGGNFSFSIGLDGNVDYDTSLDGFLGGRGSSTLQVLGYDVTLDASGISASQFLVGGQTGTFPSSVPLVITRIAGLKVFISNDLTFPFSIELDGTVDYDPSLDIDLFGRGTDRIIVFPELIYLNAQRISPGGSRTIMVVDASDLPNLSLVHEVPGNLGGGGLDVDASGYVFLSRHRDAVTGGIDVLDAALQVVGSVDVPTSLTGGIDSRMFNPVLGSNGHLYACNDARAPAARIMVFDVSDPTNPVLLNIHDIPGDISTSGNVCAGLAFDANGDLWAQGAGSFGGITRMTFDGAGDIVDSSYFTGVGGIGNAFDPQTGALLYSRVNTDEIAVQSAADPSVNVATVSGVCGGAIANPRALAFAPTGELLVSCSDGYGSPTDINVIPAGALIGLSGTVSAGALGAVPFVDALVSNDRRLALRP